MLSCFVWTWTATIWAAPPPPRRLPRGVLCFIHRLCVSETFSWRSEQAQAEEEVGCQGESRAGAGPALGPEGGLWGDPGRPIPDSRSCPSQLHTLASALPSPHTEVFQLVGLSPQCMWGSGQPVAVGARRALPGALLLWNCRSSKWTGSGSTDRVNSFLLTVLFFPVCFSRLPGSSPGGSREFKAGTASARIRKQLLN